MGWGTASLITKTMVSEFNHANAADEDQLATPPACASTAASSLESSDHEENVGEGRGGSNHGLASLKAQPGSHHHFSDFEVRCWPVNSIHRCFSYIIESRSDIWASHDICDTKALLQNFILFRCTAEFRMLFVHVYTHTKS